MESAGFQQHWMPFMIWAILPVWLLGALTGLMLPKPNLSSSSFALTRQTLDNFFEAEFFTLLADALYASGISVSKDAQDSTLSSDNESSQGEWYVTDKDLQFFKDSVESSKWDLIMDKNVPNLIVYKAWRRTLPSGKTEYKSVTIAPDTHPEEFVDLYLDDDVRPKWDRMIAEHEVLEHGSFNERQMVVRWLRKFPCRFLSSREYVIARRAFREPGVLYGITKAVNHPAAQKRSRKVVSMDVFHSMWSCRSVASPFGDDKPACETTLLHHEDFKIPENLARFAAKAGMWSFVMNMAQNVGPFVQARRKRCTFDSQDPLAYGFGGGEAHGISTLGRSSSAPEQLESIDLHSIPAAPIKGISRIATLAAVGGLAMLMRRSISSTGTGMMMERSEKVGSSSPTKQPAGERPVRRGRSLELWEM